MNIPFVISKHERPVELTKLIGGKAVNLFRLSAAGFVVPTFFAVSAELFRQQIQSDKELVRAISQLKPSGPDEPLATIRNRIAGLSIPAEVAGEIEAAFASCIPAGEFVAVRSSASDEDGSDHSFAGMHDSFLFIKGIDSVLAHIKQVWASAFNERAIAYRLENGLDVDQISVAVVVQQMIDAQASGVIFTCNPANGRTDQVVVSSVFGIGEGLVSGGLAADTFVISKVDKQVESDVVEKPQQMVFDSARGGGLETVAVDGSQQNTSSLSDAQLGDAAETAIAIEKFYRRPQDIEFCFDRAGKFYLLQARPVTRVEELGPAAGNRLVWDNSNIIESYSGVTTPMTFSFIRRAYTIVYHCFAEVMGISKTKVKTSRHVFENMLGLIRGRVFYNLQNWYRLIRLFPGFQYNSQFMESMMGIKEPLVLDDPLPEPSFWQKWFVELPALIRLLLRTSWNFIRIRPIVDEFQSSFHERYREWDAMEFSQLAPHELKSLYHEMEDALLWNWRAPIINDFYVMIYYGLLKRFCGKWCHDETGALQNDLICGEGGVESAEPAKYLLRMASVAAAQEELRSEIFIDPIEEVPGRIANDSRFAEFNRMMQEYLKLYGFRCMNELKLEEYSLRDRPFAVYQVLRNYLALEDKSALDVDAMHEREQRVRREAEERAFASIKGFRIVPRKFLFKRILRNARTGVKNRENMRFARTRIYGVVRELIRAIGRHMADDSIIGDREDVFYLTIDELWDYIQGTAVTADLRELADLRRAEFDRYRDEDSDEGEVPEDRFETFGFVYHKNLFKNLAKEVVEVEDGQLSGTGCCPGQLTHKVRVLRTPQDNMTLSGEILVAERTDPGWVPLYPAVSGILIERGSILSHSAVVAREMGIPTIVGINGLLKHVQDGDTVTMDGSSGIIELHTDE